MVWMILLTVLCADSVYGQAIIDPPEPFTGTVGGTADFRCQVVFAGVQELMSWEFNHDPVYIHQYDMEDYPKGTTKYSVVKNNTIFTLTVNKLDYGDAGRYACCVHEVQAVSALIILDTPQLFNSTPNSAEGSIAEFICSAQFRGPSKEDITLDHYPQLQMFLGGELLNGTVKEEEPGGARNYYNITQVSHLPLDISMDAKQVKCTIKTLRPEMEKSSTVEVLVPQKETDSDNDSWKIAIGVIIPICLITAMLAAFYFLGWHKKVQQCIGHEKKQYNPVSVNDKSIKDSSEQPSLPPESHIEICTVPAVKYSKKDNLSRYEYLVKTIDNLTYWEDLDDATVGKIEKFLKGIDVNHVERPTVLYRLINKADTLIQSEHFIGVTKVAAQKFAKNHEDPLLYLVEFLEKNTSLLTQHSENFMKLVKVLQQYDGPSDTRSRCLRVLLMGTREWHLCKGDLSLLENKLNTTMDCQFSLDFMDNLFLLLKDGADPAWSPEGSPEGSNLHVLMLIMQYVVSNKSNLFEKSIELLNRMMTDASLDLSNVDSEGRTILHNLVDFRKPTLLLDCLEQFEKTISLIRKKKFALLDAKDNLKRTPLHTFVISLLQGHSNSSEKNETGTITTSARSWNDHKDGLSKVLKSLITPTNTDCKCIESKTPLLEFIGCAYKWADHPDALLEVVRCLISPSNLDLKTDNGTTILHFFVTTFDKWKDHPKTYLKVLESLKSDSNINFHTEERGTLLLELTVEAHKWVDYQDVFLEIVKSLKSPENIDLQTKTGLTPLLQFASVSKKWAKCPNIFLQVVQALRSENNINFHTGNKQTALHLVTLNAKMWASNPEVFLDVVKCLKSAKNIDICNKDKKTPMHEFILAAKEWKDHQISFLEVLNCLSTSNNIDVQSSIGQTALHQFIASGWTHCPDTFEKIVKCLKSSSNINVQDSLGYTPLHYMTFLTAECANNSDIFLGLIICLKSNFNIGLKSKKGETALNIFYKYANNWKYQQKAVAIQCLKLSAA